MTASAFLKYFKALELPVAVVNVNLDLVEVNDAAKELFEPVFINNGLKAALNSEEKIEIEYKLRDGKNVNIRPKNGIFKGGIIELIPICDISGGDALLFMTDYGYSPFASSHRQEKQFISRFFEPKMREAVSSIFSNADMIRNNQATVLSDKAEVNLENITCEAYRILRWADHVRLIAQAESGDMNITTSNIIDFTRNLVDSAKIMLRGYEFSEEYRVDTESRRAMCSFDRDALTRSLLCLISNSCKATGKGGMIKICVTLTESDYRFSVTNGGSYIPPQFLSQVTEPYFSYEDGTAFGKGMGLGLTVAKYVAEYHGGGIFIQSSEEYGTTVVLRIPVAINYSTPNFIGQSQREYLMDRYSPVFVELYDF